MERAEVLISFIPIYGIEARGWLQMSEKYQHQYRSIRTPADLRAIPGYEEVIDFSESSGRKLLEMLDDYQFAKIDEFPCGIKGCRTPHQYGYLVRTTDGKITNIGRDCGKRHLKLEFTKARKAFREKRKAADNLKSIMTIKEGLSPYEDRINNLLSLSRALNDCREVLREKMPLIHGAVVTMAEKGTNQIIQSRRMNKREAEIHYLHTGTSRKDYEGGRPTIEEAVARLDGCGYFRANLGLTLRKKLTPPIDELKSLTAEQIERIKPKELENLSRNINNALRLIDWAESLAEIGLKFFSQDNIQKLSLMGATPEQISRLGKEVEKLQTPRAHQR